MTNSNLIKIQSTITIQVTPNTHIQDLTDKKSLSPNKLQAIMSWNHEPVLIKQGVYEYPAELKNWDSVKALEKANILTISTITTKEPSNGTTKHATK